MLSSSTATEVAFLRIAVLQAVASLVWALGAWFVHTERAALGHWAVYAGLSSTTWFLLALHLRSPPLVAVVIGVCSAIALRRGIRLFIGRALHWGMPVLSIVLVLPMHATLMALVVARRDSLTGLLNRRAMHALLDEQARQRRRAAAPPTPSAC